MKQHFITNESGTRLCLHQVEATGTSAGTVILAHGMFSNYRACKGLASYLATLNYDCLLLDFQGHGFSHQANQSADLESMWLEDTKAALDFAYKLSDAPVCWIGHSGGGLAILMYLAHYPHHQNRLAGIVTLASQATDAGLIWNHRIFLQAARFILRVVRVAPGKVTGLGPENEQAHVLDQWIRWNISKQWLSGSGFDYLTRMADIRIPILGIAGVADKFIAPLSGCKKLYGSLGSEDKMFLLAGTEFGFLEDYTHARLISSHNASTDIWPLIGKWLTLADRSELSIPLNQYGR